MWHRIAGLIIKFRIALLLLLLVITAFMGYHASHVELSYEFTKAIPTNNPKYREYQEFLKQFGEDGNQLVIAVQSDHFFEPAWFSDYTRMVHELERVPAVIGTVSIPSAMTFAADSTGGLRTRKITEGNADPAGVRSSLYNLPFYRGLLFNPAAHTYLMVLSIDKKTLNSKRRKDVVDRITTIANAFGTRHHTEMHFSGLPLIRTEMAAQVSAEMRLFLILSFALTAVILLLFFRSVVAVVSSMLVVAAGVIWSVGTIVLLGYKISLLTALIPPLIVVIGIPNCVYFLNKYHSEYHLSHHKIKSLLRMVDRMGIVTLFTNLTAAIGFGVFFFTHSVLLQEFGLVAGLNIIGVFFISLIFLPALFSLLPPPAGNQTDYLESGWMTRLLNTLTTWIFSHRSWIFGITGALSVVAVLGILRLNNETHIVDDLPKSDKVYRDLVFFEKNFGGVMPLEIVIDTKKKNAATFPQTFAKMDSLTEYLHTVNGIGHTIAVTEFIKFAYQGMVSGDSNSYVLPDRMVLSTVSTLLRNRKAGKDSTFSKLLASFMDPEFRKTRISIKMADIGSKRLPPVLSQIRSKTYSLFDSSKYDVRFTGTSIVFLEGNKFIIDSLRDSLLLAFVMIFGCMVFLFRSWRILLISIVVNIIPLLFTAGIMGWAGIPIKPSTVLVFSVALGITIDVTIRFLVNFKQEMDRNQTSISETVRRTMHDTGLSIIYTSLILIAGFGVFSLSHFDGTKALGYLTSLTLLLAMVANLTLQPALLLWMEKVRKGKTPQWIQEMGEKPVDEA